MCVVLRALEAPSTTLEAYKARLEEFRASFMEKLKPMRWRV